MIENTIDKISNTIETIFTIGIIVFIGILLFYFFKSIIDSQRKHEREEKEKKDNEKLINTIISEAKTFPINVVISQRDSVREAYNELLECKRTGSHKIKTFVLIRVGDKLGCGMDLNTCRTVLHLLNEEIARRKNKINNHLS
jgi:hypothetical protein